MNTAKLSTGNHSLPRQQSAWLAARIALRYVSVGRRSQLVSFMSLLTIGGLALSVTILIAVLSVMNGFDREVRENVLGVLPHATVSTQERPRSASWMA
ncbi:MAG: hypothetical protein Q8L06_02290, partial [Pseudohongiella sp.]|nr:hypothetical protein [Pseudohongiella sp.]